MECPKESPYLEDNGGNHSCSVLPSFRMNEGKAQIEVKRFQEEHTSAVEKTAFRFSVSYMPEYDTERGSAAIENLRVQLHESLTTHSVAENGFHKILRTSVSPLAYS